MKLQNKLGKLIRKAREEKGMTQLDLSTLLGYGSVQFVSLMERGVSKVPRATFKKLFKILDLNRKDIFDLIVRDFTQQLQSEI